MSQSTLLRHATRPALSPSLLLATLLAMLVACNGQTCIDFEDEPLGPLSNLAPYGIQLKQLGSDPPEAMVQDTDHTHTTATKEVFLVNTALVFQFDETYPGLTFNWADRGGSVYMSVNGQSSNGPDMQDLNFPAPITYEVDQPKESNHGRVRLGGGIDSLEVGGDELVVTYFCKTP